MRFTIMLKHLKRTLKICIILHLNTSVSYIISIKSFYFLIIDINDVTTKADIYSFGICALEMATRGGLSSNGDSQSAVSQEQLKRVLESLENPLQKDFISQCLNPDPDLRPSARELLFHPALFEVHSLKLVSAHVIINSKLYEHISEDDLRIDNSKPALDFGGHTYTYVQLETIQANKV